MRGAAQRSQGKALLILLRIGGGFLLGAGILFMQVWWPIQAERSLDVVKKIQADISLRKAELNELNRRTATLTSLTVLDQWAKLHGPWKSPRAEDVIALEK